MSDNTFKGPTFRYGPNGEAQVFHDSRHVPEGWLDDPKKHTVITDATPLTRSEIIGQLKERGVTFRFTAKTDVLYALLMSHVERENEE